MNDNNTTELNDSYNIVERENNDMKAENSSHDINYVHEHGTGEEEDDTMYNYETKELTCSRDLMSIYGVAYIPKGNKQAYPTVVIGHGFTGTYRDNLKYAEYLAKHGIASYSFDFCGGSNGTKSDGKTTEMSVVTETEDMKAVISLIKQQDFVDIDNLFLMGESQGGFVAALTASELKDQIEGLILLYPAFCIPNNGRKQFGNIYNISESSMWGVSLGKCYYEDVWEMDVNEEISKYEGNVLIFHGTDDDLVDLSYSKSAADAYAHAELVVYENAGHGFYGKQAAEASENMVQFINNTKKGVQNNEKNKIK